MKLTKKQNEVLSLLLMTLVTVGVFLYGCSKFVKTDEPKDYKKELCNGCLECELN